MATSGEYDPRPDVGDMVEICSGRFAPGHWRLSNDIGMADGLRGLVTKVVPTQEGVMVTVKLPKNSTAAKDLKDFVYPIIGLKAVAT